MTALSVLAIILALTLGAAVTARSYRSPLLLPDTSQVRPRLQAPLRVGTYRTYARRQLFKNIVTAFVLTGAFAVTALVAFGAHGHMP